MESLKSTLFIISRILGQNSATIKLLLLTGVDASVCCVAVFCMQAFSRRYASLICISVFFCRIKATLCTCKNVETLPWYLIFLIYFTTLQSHPQIITAETDLKSCGN